MERRYETRLKEMLVQAQFPSALVAGLLERLQSFAEPYAMALTEPEQRRHTVEYIRGLLSKPEHETGEAIAYLYDHERQGIQKFIGHVPRDHQPLLETLAQQVGTDLGEPDAVIVFDPSSFPKKGTKSVGVARQWCGRLGKVENCRVAVYMGHVSPEDHALVNTRLYLPEDWAKSKARRTEAGVPRKIRFQTRHELAPEMPDEQGSVLPHARVAGDDEMGRPASFRQALRGRGQRYLSAVPSNTLVRDQDEPPPPYSGRGRHPKSPFARVDRWCRARPEASWTTVDVRDGEKGPLTVEVIACRVQGRTETGGTGPDEVLFVTRERRAGGNFKHDYYLSNAGADVSAEELSRVSRAAHRIEECFRRAKSEAGLADYQVRNWIAWHHHQALSMLAAWFLNQETRRGKKPDGSADKPPGEATGRRNDRGTREGQRSGRELSSQHPVAGTYRESTVLFPSLA